MLNMVNYRVTVHQKNGSSVSTKVSNISIPFEIAPHILGQEIQAMLTVNVPVKLVIAYDDVVTNFGETKTIENTLEYENKAWVNSNL